MALLKSNMVPLGTIAPTFDLPDAYGKTHSLDSFKNARVLVVIFMCNHCPYVKAVLDRLIDLANHFEGQGAQFVGINPNDPVKYPDDSPEAMRTLIEEKKIPFPYLIDETQETARAYDAVCTPDIYVYGEDRTLAYRGRLDDNWQEPVQVTEESLKLAIESMLTGKTVSDKQIPSMGCSIKWK